MDRCSRWFHTEARRDVEMPVPLTRMTAGAVVPGTPGDRDRCPVCGGLVARHPERLAQIVYRDGTVVFFDGSRDLFRYLLDPHAVGWWPEGAPVAGIFVTVYPDRRPIDARRASFVAGSGLLGPMGAADLVPLASAGEARALARDHEGSRVLSFGEVTRGVLDGLG